jgi:hypothetical protein
MNYMLFLFPIVLFWMTESLIRTAVTQANSSAGRWIIEHAGTNTTLDKKRAEGNMYFHGEQTVDYLKSPLPVWLGNTTHAILDDIYKWKKTSYFVHRKK